MIFTLSGTNDFKIDERARAIMESQDDGVGIVYVDAEELEPSELIQALSSTSLFNPAQAFVVKGLHQKGEQAVDVLDAVKPITRDTTIVVIAPRMDKRTRFYKALQKETRFEVYDTPETNELITWLVDLANKEQGSLSRELAAQLIERVGTDQYKLRNELIKLIDYDPEISKGSIEYLVARSPREDVFALLDATIAHNGKAAIKIYDDLREQQLDPRYILSMIVWQLTTMTGVKSTMKLDIDEAAKTSGVSPFVIKKQRPLLTNISFVYLKEMIASTVKTDMALKQSKASPDALLKHLIMNLSR